MSPRHSSVVQGLPSMCKALGSIPSKGKKQIKEVICCVSLLANVKPNENSVLTVNVFLTFLIAT